MMWPKLELLRELLRENGSVWVSINDNEGLYRKVILNEVSGRIEMPHVVPQRVVAIETEKIESRRTAYARDAVRAKQRSRGRLVRGGPFHPADVVRHARR